MKYVACFLFLSFLSIALKAQNCNCEDNFRFLTEKIKNNYVAFPDKITERNEQVFKKFTDSLRGVALQANPYQCLSLMREWLSYFNDKHIQLAMDFNKLNPDSVRAFFSKEYRVTWTEDSFKKHLEDNENKLDDIEGVWTYGIYEVGIIKSESDNNLEFIGFIVKADNIRWMPQQIKFKLRKDGNTYKTIYFSGGDHSVNYPKLEIHKDILDFGSFGKWKRGRRTEIKKPVQLYNDPNLMASFKDLDNETSLIIMPSFDTKYKIKIDSLIDSNKKRLTSINHLIIDVRDNSGGTTGCFEKLLPYLYTNPINIAGGIVLATEDNIRDCYEKNYPYSTEVTKRKIRKNAKILREHLGEFYPLYKSTTIKNLKRLESPERISILMNENTASSGELFILRAEQSKKATLFGKNTAGSVDYGEVAITHTPCNVFTLIYPVAKSLLSITRPLDNIGIAPQVEISTDTSDWVDFVKNYSSNNDVKK